METILERLVNEDFGIDYSSTRWGRSSDHSSLVIDKEKQIFFWNSKGLVGDALFYLLNVRGMPEVEAREYLKLLGYSSTYVLTTTPGEQEDIIVYPALIDAFYELGKYHREYWYTRKLTDLTIDRFQLGWYDSWYLVPIFMDGTFRQFQKRRDLPKKEVGRWYRGVPPLLFNEGVLRVTDFVVVAEGPNDVLALAQQGIPAVCVDVGAETWLPEWYPKFTNCKDIVICYDNDSGGEFGSRKVVQHLGIYRTKIYNFWEFDKSYSPSYFFRDGGTKEQFNDLIKEKSKYIFELPNSKGEKKWTKKFFR